VLDGVVTFAAAGPSSPPRSGRLVVGVNYFGTVELLLGMRPFLARANAPAAIAIGSNVTTHGAVQRRLLEACLAGDESLATSLGEEFGPALSYMSSKTALSHWVRRNAVKPEWIGAGITLNLVAPGTTDTPQLAEVRDNPATAAALAEYPVPLGRFVRPEEMAGVVAYLLGPDARIFCGAVLFADGGSDAFLRPDDWPLPPPERQLND
jgi:NAD(P)-dependent dehydrogenase (short-subunit alcohol dehydrogenase family)